MNATWTAIRFAAIASMAASTLATCADEPDFGPNVFVFDPRTPNMETRLKDLFTKQERAQFGSDRFAVLFKPGKYSLDMQQGFYTQTCGLGRQPDDVQITGGIRVTAKWMDGNATCNFWRSIENMSITPAGHHAMTWAVSQGTWLRRVHIKGDLHLWDNGWSSGGFIADSKIDGLVVSGSQQQWMSRNAEWNRWDGGVWNMVFVGVDHPPAGEWPQRPYTVVDRTPVVREKPYLFVDDSSRYFVMVPELLPSGSAGTTWRNGPTIGEPVPLERFYIAHAGTDTAKTINVALASGKHLLLTPGIYKLDGAIEVNRPGTVVLGLGYPTLIPQKGMPAMTIADVDGANVSGLILDAGPMESPTLLEAGPAGTSKSHEANPIVLADITARAGGATGGSAGSFIKVNASDTIGDNLWLWRADHGEGASWAGNKVRNGLVVNGSNVTMYGLFVEHTEEYQVLWNGEGGRVYFYQSEMPYDPPSQDAWMHEGVRGYASYKVGEKVRTHEAWGLGVYCVFTAAPVIAETAIEAPTGPGVKFHHMITFRLSGKPDSGINHVLNDQGTPVIKTQAARLN